MGLTATQMKLCFESYWYMWLTNGLAGLIFIGINIGVAAFFLKKFQQKKRLQQTRAPEVTETNRRPFSPSEINTYDDPYADPNDGSASRNSSRKSPAYPNSSEDNDEFAQSTVRVLNAYRAQHNADPLTMNEQLSEIAQRWADQMARSGKLEHSPAEMRNFGRQTLGENFESSFQSELTGEKMVKKWMKQSKRYMFGFDGRKDTENFTQAVWHASREVGVGRARSEDGNWWYGVAVFDPPGNIPNQFSQNVLLPQS